MKLYYLSLSEIPSLAAHSVHVMKMCSAFASMGLDVTLYCRNGAFPCDDPYAFYSVENRTFTLKRLPFYPIRILGTLLQTFAMLCILLSHRIRGERGVYYGRDPFSLCCAAWLGLPVAIELHMVPVRRSWKFCVRQILASRRFLGMVCISQGLAREVKSVLHKDIPILVAHDGADDPAANAVPKENMQTPDSAFHLHAGYVGSLYAGRGIEFILELAERNPNIAFHFAGGSAEEVALWKENAPGNAFFFGFMPQKALPEFYARLDVMLAPYANHVEVDANTKGTAGSSTAAYMSPLKLFEYMSYGKPFIASAMPAIEEITGRDDTICLLRPYGDAAAWSDALARLAENPERRQTLSEACRAKFLHEFTWRKRAENIASLWASRYPEN